MRPEPAWLLGVCWGLLARKVVKAFHAQGAKRELGSPPGVSSSLNVALARNSPRADVGMLRGMPILCLDPPEGFMRNQSVRSYSMAKGSSPRARLRVRAVFCLPSSPRGVIRSHSGVAPTSVVWRLANSR